MSETDIEEAERHRAKMVKRKAVQDAEVASKTIAEGPADRPHRPRQRQIDGGLRACVARARPWLADRRRAVHQGRRETGERTALERFGDQVVWHTMGEGFTWETQDRARDIAAAERAWAKAQALMADPSIRLVVLDELNIALRYDYLPLDEVVAALAARRPRPACRRHRPQRQAGADRGGRSRHRDGAGQASFRRRREGAGRHRVLMARPRALMFQGTGLGCRQVADRRRASAAPCRDRGLRGAPVQAAEHVEQCRGDGRRRRDRPRPGAAGARLRASPPSVHMNPVLLKPQSEIGAQVVVQGQVIGNAQGARISGAESRADAAPCSRASRGCGREADLVLVEGAGSARRDQPARQRHRQYGLCPRRRRARSC